MRITLVSQGNLLVAPVVAWILCAPKYLVGTMSLGEVAQAAAAFVTVQAALNWLVDNFPGLADCLSSINRVASLLVALDEVDPRPPYHPGARIAGGADTINLKHQAAMAIQTQKPFDANCRSSHADAADSCPQRPPRRCWVVTAPLSDRGSQQQGLAAPRSQRLIENSVWLGKGCRWPSVCDEPSLRKYEQVTFKSM